VEAVLLLAAVCWLCLWLLLLLLLLLLATAAAMLAGSREAAPSAPRAEGVRTEPAIANASLVIVMFFVSTGARGAVAPAGPAPCRPRHAAGR
jgi:hypothetical protein